MLPAPGSTCGSLTGTTREHLAAKTYSGQAAERVSASRANFCARLGLRPKTDYSNRHPGGKNFLGHSFFTLPQLRRCFRFNILRLASGVRTI